MKLTLIFVSEGFSVLSASKSNKIIMNWTKNSWLTGTEMINPYPLKMKLQNWFLYDIKGICRIYCGVISIRERPMFVTLVGYPCPRINITAKIYTTICLILIEIILITLTNEITSPRTRKLLAIHEY